VQEPNPAPDGLRSLIRPRVTLRELASAAGCSYSYMAKVSAGTRRPNERVKRAVEELCNVPWSAVFPNEDARGRG
jgi:transcriptional regulator with XRE-family HTH domain